MKPMQRREWLRQMAALGAFACLPTTRLWAAPGAGGPRLLVVMLRGAYDGLGALVPYAEPFYYEARPNIAVPPPSAGASGGLSAMRLDGQWGLHPMLAESAGELYAGGALAFVPFCGTGFVSRSHFQAQDWLETGKLPEQRPDVNDGFLNRLVKELGGQAVSFTQNLPVALRGSVKVSNAAVGAARNRPMSADFNDQVLAMYAGHPLEPMVSDGLGLRRNLAMELAQEMEESARQAVGASGFVLEAQRVARYMRDNPRIGTAFIDVGGWDTHAGQGGAQGALAGRLASLGQGLEVLSMELGPVWSETVVVVVSEFGRTFRENGSRGTDHGHGSVMWLAGGGVAGGKIRGEQARLDAASLHQGRDMPVLNEYRSVLAGLFSRMYGLKPEVLSKVFPGAKPLDLSLL